MRYVIYNPLSCNGIGIEMKNSFFKKYNFDIYKEINILEINLEEFISNLDINDELILIGGDGTLNVFVNEYKKANIHNKLFLYAGGSGNDFIKDIDKNLNELIEITKYAKNLPVVKVDNISKYFFNNVGFGIDGKVCYKAEELKKKKKKFNYTFIAAKLLLLYKKKM